MKIKAITLTQPYATLIALKEKRVETRGWRTHYPGPLAIHASANMPKEYRWMCQRKPFIDALYRHGVGIPTSFGERIDTGGLPLGKVVAITNIQGCRTIPEVFQYRDSDAFSEHFGHAISAKEKAFGNYEAGRFAWLLGERILPLPEPIPTKGKQGLWDWECPDEVWAQYVALMGGVR